MTAARLAPIVLLAGLLGGCASFTPTTSTSTDDSVDLQAQVFKVQKDTAQLIEKMGQLQESLGQQSDRGGACAEAAARSENVEKQLRVLEEQLLATQKRLDDALVELRSQRRAPAVGRAGAAETPPPAPSPAPAASPATPPGSPPPPASPHAAAAGDQSPEDLFNGAYADYSRGNYDLAQAGFEAALAADPEGPLADDAQYWIGEVLFARGQYLEAAAAFDKVITGWPAGDKVGMARLKKGYSLYEGKKTAEGVLELQKVMEAAPKSDEARLARDFLRRKGVVVD